MLAFHYTHPRTGADVEIRQPVRVPQPRWNRSHKRMAASLQKRHIDGVKA